ITEKDLVEQEGLNYLRYCVTDHHKPDNKVVDQFVEFAKNIPESMWLHFHCRGGVGRTTTFMTIYDMMKNAENLRYEDILERQQLIGGRDMYKLAKNSDKHIAAVERLSFILKFYNYCIENKNNGFKRSWSEWLSNNF